MRFNSQPPEGGCACVKRVCSWAIVFQLTAARRRLLNKSLFAGKVTIVSTHSRPKAAAASPGWGCVLTTCFNSQPPEGGCSQ